MTLNDLLKSALKGIEHEQRDNPDPKLDALGSHIAVVLAELEAAAASEASAPPKSKEPVDQRSAAAPAVAPSKPTAAKWRVVKDPRLKG